MCDGRIRSQYDYNVQRAWLLMPVSGCACAWITTCRRRISSHCLNYYDGVYSLHAASTASVQYRWFVRRIRRIDSAARYTLLFFLFPPPLSPHYTSCYSRWRTFIVFEVGFVFSSFFKNGWRRKISLCWSTFLFVQVNSTSFEYYVQYLRVYRVIYH